MRYCYFLLATDDRQKRGIAYSFICAWFFVFSLGAVKAQENIPIGAWRTHLSFNSIRLLVEGDNKIFAASENGVMQYDLATHAFTSYTTLNALSNTGISALAYDKLGKQLVIGYTNGGIDLVNEQRTIYFTRLINPPDINVGASINHIQLQDGLVYLSTNYGVVLFDPVRHEVRETWRNLGNNGQLLAVYQSAILRDSIYLASTQGILAGRLTDNLLDFNQWKRFASGDLNTAVKSIGILAEKVMTGVNTKGIFYFDGNTWQKNTSLPVLSNYQFLSGSNNKLLVGGDQRLYAVDALHTVIELIDPQLVSPVAALMIEDIYWVGDAKQGLLSTQSGSWNTYLPNGPSSPFTFKTVYSNTSLLALHGGFTEQFVAANSLKRISKFNQGLWASYETQLNFISDCEGSSQESLYVSSFGEGLEKLNADGSEVLFTPLNSPLRYVTALSTAASGLWIANYGSAQSLNLLTPSAMLQSFSFSPTAARYPFEIAVDASENIWMLIAPAGGGGVFIVKKDGSVLRQLTDQPGEGLLPNEQVLSIAVDKSDYVWIGTAQGVAYYTYTGEDGIRPLVEGRFLLTEERVTALAVDGGNRKWMGTDRGIWLFNASGDEVIHNFTVENSPLPSNAIKDIEIHQQSGEVFITTDKGLISFRSDATEEKSYSEEVKIFPNPVSPGFMGLVGIANLMENADIKIVDVSGKLIRQLQANGGSVSWNVADQTGKRVKAGMYLVITSSQDGSESIAGKIVVVE